MAPLPICRSSSTRGHWLWGATLRSILGWVEPIGDYEALAKRAKPIRLGDLDLLVIDLDDLIRIKQHIQRPKDRESLMQLLAIKRVMEEQGGGGAGSG